MTISFPDLSNHNGALAIEPGTVAVSAKASESTTFTDADYAHYKTAAAKAGAVFYAYHFFHAGNASAQAAHCYSVVGPGVAVMIDCEPVGTSKPTVADCVTFANAYRALGGLVKLVYFPHWYWIELGQPDLTPLKAAGLSLISSAYTTYSDTGEGWNSYGGITPVLWQWTDKQSYSGANVDFNAFKGTAGELAGLLGYSTAVEAVLTKGAPNMILISVTPDPTVEGSTNAGIFVLYEDKTTSHVDPPSLAGLSARLGAPAVVSPEFYSGLNEILRTEGPPPDSAAVATAVMSALAQGVLTTNFTSK